MALLFNGLFSLVLEGSMLSSGSPSINVWTTIACADLCLAETSCVAFFYNKKSRFCQLHNSHDLTDATLKSDSGMRFYVLHKESCPVEKQSCPEDQGYNVSTDPRLCYKLYTTEQNHDDALAACHNDGGFLIRIDSKKRNDYIPTIRQHAGITNGRELWIDGSYNDDKWRFSHLTSMTYEHWASSSSGGSCIYITGNASWWYKADCNSNKKYICEIPIT